MKLHSVELTIRVCTKHLDSTSSYGSQIEAFLTQHLLIIICAEIEKKIKEMIIAQARDRCSDDFQTFIESCLNSTFRSIQSSEIAGLLNKFGTARKERFRELVDERAKTAYDSIVVNRHDIAHGSGSNLTFREAVEFYRRGLSVIESLSTALHE